MSDGNSADPTAPQQAFLDPEGTPAIAAVSTRLDDTLRILSGVIADLEATLTRFTERPPQVRMAAPTDAKPGTLRHLEWLEDELAKQVVFAQHQVGALRQII